MMMMMMMMMNNALMSHQNGVLSSLPFLARVFTGALFAILSDHLTTQRKLTVSQSRKLFQCIGQCISSV